MKQFNDKLAAAAMLSSLATTMFFILATTACQRNDVNDQSTEQSGQFEVVARASYVTLIRDTKTHCEYIETTHGLVHRLGDSCTYNNPNLDKADQK